jgi:hypothetical protein
MPRSSRTSRALILVAFMALVCMGGALYEESFVHTDDGCAVEVHCLACRLAAGTTAVVGPAIAVPVAGQVAGTLAPEPRIEVADAAPREAQSRAPPLA